MTTISADLLSREQRITALCATGCGVLAIVIPLTVAGFWALGSWNFLALVRLLPPDILHVMAAPIAPWQRVTGALICLVPAVLVSYALARAYRSLTAFTRGDFFASDVVRGLRDYGRASFWAAVAGILSVPVLSVAMTFTNAHGHRELSLDLSGAPLLNLLAAGIVWVVAQAMTRAADIARENEQFV